jgi:hypothetical protein
MGLSFLSLSSRLNRPLVKIQADVHTYPVEENSEFGDGP